MKDLQKYVDALKIENGQLGGHNTSRSGGSQDSTTSSIRRVSLEEAQLEGWNMSVCLFSIDYLVI